MAIVPLTFVLAYYADLTYGSKLHRIHGITSNAICQLLKNTWTTITYTWIIRFVFLYFIASSRSRNDSAKRTEFIGVAERLANSLEHWSSSYWYWHRKATTSTITINVTYILPLFESFYLNIKSIQWALWNLQIYLKCVYSVRIVLCSLFLEEFW